MPVHPVSRLRQSLITHRRPALCASDNALYLKPPHQSLYRTTCHVMAFSLKLTPDLPGAVHLVILIPHAIDRLRQRLVPLHPGRYACRVRCPGLVLVVRRRGDGQLLAYRLDPKYSPVLVDGCPPISLC